mgnify:CR=1 FL=1
MITIENLTKKFGDFTALSNISCQIQDNCIYGMVGSNGAGKSTLLRVLAGVYKQDSGAALMDGKVIWENPEVKSHISYVSDELYYPAGATMDKMADIYSNLYPSFDRKKYVRLMEALHLERKKSLNAFSKGMRRQAITILALATNPEYIYFDETFDGLDPVMRNYIKHLIVEDMNERKSTAIITSHSLRELEDTCDQLALLHKGGIVLQSDIANIKTSRFKVQIAFTEEYDVSKFEGLDIILFRKSGSVSNIIINGDREETWAKLNAMNPILLEILPLTLEEVFTYEMQALGYAFDVDTEGGILTDRRRTD